jgi:hypothetical protein
VVVRQKKLKLPPQFLEKSNRPKKNSYICCIIFPKQGARNHFLTSMNTLKSKNEIEKCHRLSQPTIAFMLNLNQISKK